MKVEKLVGWYQGLAGVGNVFEISDGARLLLATIWQDGKFHRLTVADLKAGIAIGKAAAEVDFTKHSDAVNFQQGADGSLAIENPSIWERFYKEPQTNTGTVPPATSEPEQVIDDEIEIPVSISFSGVLKVNIGGFSKLFKILE